MDKDEAKAVIKDMISSLIRDDAEAASQQLHDVLAAKMRDRLNPPSQDRIDNFGYLLKRKFRSVPYITLTDFLPHCLQGFLAHSWRKTYKEAFVLGV